MLVKWNKAELRDKIYACWQGKNIGGTLGTPYEGKTELQDIHGFASPKGEPLPNDDLDLQLVWLRAMQEVGPQALDANTLGWYWLRTIPPNWNEYGIGKSNLRMGLLPPMCGEVKNDGWKTSNGAWIRSEVWACLAPGFPQVAMTYGIMDACIDHGISEGTVAEMFTTALESMAFFCKDARSAIEKALVYIPKESRVSRLVRLVMTEYDKGTPWKDTRTKVLEVNDLGWFQAPANIAYTVIGLLYGERDFKRSVYTAINCGDDTDCTGATCGAVMGILGGTQAIPQDLAEYIGDRIVTVAMDRTFGRTPATCKELTEQVIDLMPEVLHAYGVTSEWTEGVTEIDLAAAEQIPGRQPYTADFLNRSPYSYDIRQNCLSAVVEYDQEPMIRPCGESKVRVTFRNVDSDPHWEAIRVSLPEGWTAEYPHSQYLEHRSAQTSVYAKWEMTVTAGEHVDAVNRGLIEVVSEHRPLPLYIPLVWLG